MRESLLRLLDDLETKYHEHMEGYADAESLYEKAKDDGASDALDYAIKELRKVLADHGKRTDEKT